MVHHDHTTLILSNIADVQWAAESHAKIIKNQHEKTWFEYPLTIKVYTLNLQPLIKEIHLN